MEDLFCRRCNRRISEDEFEDNRGLCDSCYELPNACDLPFGAHFED